MHKPLLRRLTWVWKYSDSVVRPRLAVRPHSAAHPLCGFCTGPGESSGLGRANGAFCHGNTHLFYAYRIGMHMRFAYILCMHILHAYCALMLTIHVYKGVISVAAPETLMDETPQGALFTRHACKGQCVLWRSTAALGPAFPLWRGASFSAETS